MVHKSWQAGIVFATLLVSGCSQSKTLDRHQLRSHFRSAISFAAESIMFFDYVRQGRATRHYAREHAEYLVEAVDRSLKELQKLTPGQGMDTALYECEAQLAMLQSELSSIRNGADDNALAAARQKIAGIRDRLEKANSQL